MDLPLNQHSGKINKSIQNVSMKRRFVFFLIVELVIIIVAIFYGKANGDIFQPFSESGFLTGISFMQLLAISGYSWGIFRIHEISFNLRALKSTHVIWLFVAVGFLFLSFDEIFEIHEQTDKLIHELFHIEETAFTDRMDDVIVLLYAFIGVTVIYRYRKGLKKYKATLPYLKWALTFFYIMVLLDILSNRRDIFNYLIEDGALAKMLHVWSGIGEESFKFLAEGALFAVAFRCSQIVNTDPLIETSGSIYFYKALRKAHHRASRYAHGYGLIVCDIDHYNPYVNIYGDSQGKDLIKAIADRMFNMLRYSDDVFRRSSREIIIIVHDQDIEGTALVAEKIRAYIESFHFENKGSDKGIVTLSCGISAYDKEQKGQTWKSILNHADKALNNARALGRNRVCLPDERIMMKVSS